MDWNKIFSPELFLKDMVERGEIEEEELQDDVYGRVVCSLCHNSVAWMYMTVLEEYPQLLDNLFLVTGSYEMGIGAKLDHSWVEYRKDGKNVALDLTLSQFRVVQDKLYIGDKLEQLSEWESACFANYEDMKKLIQAL